MRITDGTSQADRFPKALQEGYIEADEMSFEDLLAMGADYAGLLKFFNRSNQADQSWEPFFTSDALVIFARILALDLKKIEAAFFGEFLKNPYMVDLADVPTYQLALRINNWFKCLETIESNAGQKLLSVIQSVIENKLREQLHRLGSFFGPPITVKDFEGIWDPKKKDEPHSEPTHSRGKDPSGDEYFLRSNFAAFYNAVRLVRETARKLRPEAKKSQVHNPAIGMYVAFIELYQNVQQKLNHFTAKHLDYYYRDVLKIQPRPSIPDQAYLTFDTDIAEREVLIGAGTEFTAGTDENNNDIIYTANNDLLVNNARVESLFTLFLDRDPLIYPEKDLEFVTGAKINQIPVREASGLAGDRELQSRPIFGAHRRASQKRVVADAMLGLALASPVLWLKEGQREIQIVFKIELADTAGFKSLDDFLSKVIRKLNDHDLLDDLPVDEPATAADIFFKTFRRMFTIQLTAENGWYEVADYLPLHKVAGAPCAEDGLCIQLKLSPKDPPIVPYAADCHGDGYDTDQPIIRFMINPSAYLYPFSLLKAIVIKEVGVRVNVSGVRDLVIHNNLGPLDPNGPFHPFGPLPAVGAYFIIGNQEAAGKPLTRIDVEVEWAGLPVGKGGFQAYYRAYGMDFDDAVFEAELDVLNDGRWQPGGDGDSPRIKLFESSADGIARSRRLPCQDAVQYFSPLAEGAAPGEYGYNAFRKDGFFRFTLASPPYAFGHWEYPLQLTRVLTENAKLKKLRLHKPIPNPPYAPKIDRLALNYEAHVSFNFEKSAESDEMQGRGGIFHIHPLGVERLSPLTHPSITMVPPYESDGNLFIGLRPAGFFGTLTLLFNLRDDSTLPSDDDPPELTWHYLSANRWQRLENHHVLSDTTNGFLTSGIVTLSIPERQRGTSTAMPGNLLWLRVSPERDPQIPCSVFSIHAQALGVTWLKPGDSSVHKAFKLPAGTIKDSRISIPGIDRIVQIAESFGARRQEAADQFKTRVSERLRHKNRATVPWDYERLILDHFPQIHKVKCFANMVDDHNPERQQRPGHILIVVIPRLEGTSAATMKPMAPGMLLTEIGEFVRCLSSPFVALKVRNPAYEKIQVRCRVQFKPEKSGGYYLQKLNQALVDYLSPWEAAGYTAEFGWRVRRHDIKSYIRKQDYIHFVTDFSMLRVAEDDEGTYELFDTVRRETEDDGMDDTKSDKRYRRVKEVRPYYPWSIAVPFKQHYIEVSAKTEMKYPSPTGIKELEIGSNFIVSGK